MMLSSDFTSFYANILIIDTSNIIKGFVSNEDQFTWKAVIPQHKALVNLVLTTTSYTDGKKFICALIKNLLYPRHYTLQKFVIVFLMAFVPFLMNNFVKYYVYHGENVM